MDESLEYLVRTHKELVSVKIGRSNCTDRGLQAVMSNPNIVVLKVCSNKILGENLEDSSTHVLDLKVLDLGGCSGLTERGLANIISRTNASNLKELNLRACCKMTDSGLVSILNKIRDSLKKLDLSYIDLALTDIGSLTASLSSIEDLNLSYCRNLTDSVLFSILNKTGDSLKKLDLSGTNLTLNEIGSLSASLSSIEDLNLSWCRNLTDSGLVSILNKTGYSLKKLDLSYSNLTLNDIGSFSASLSSIEDLNLSCCDELTDSRLVSILNKTGNSLKKLDLSNTNLTLTDIGSLTASFSSIEDLNLSCCRNLTDSGLVSILNKTGDSLKKLNLSCTILSLTDIGSFSASFSSIEDLILRGCRNLTDSGLVSILNKTRDSLKKLDLSYTDLTLTDIGSLTASLSSIEDLNLSFCPNLTDSGLLSILNKTGQGHSISTQPLLGKVGSRSLRFS